MGGHREYSFAVRFCRNIADPDGDIQLAEFPTGPMQRIAGVLVMRLGSWLAVNGAKVALAAPIKPTPLAKCM